MKIWKYENMKILRCITLLKCTKINENWSKLTKCCTDFENKCENLSKFTKINRNYDLLKIKNPICLKRNHYMKLKNASTFYENWSLFTKFDALLNDFGENHIESLKSGKT